MIYGRAFEVPPATANKCSHVLIVSIESRLFEYDVLLLLAH